MTLQDIRKIVEESCEVNLSKRSRKREYVYARWIFYRIAKDNTTKILSQIGREINKCHATVIYGLREFNKVVETDSKLKELYYVCLFVINNKKELNTPVSVEEYLKRKIKHYKLEIQQKDNIIINVNNNDLRELLKLDKETIDFFCETRLKPFLKMQESKVTNNDLIQKQILTRTM